jgi:hypothetical protein
LNKQSLKTIAVLEPPLEGRGTGNETHSGDVILRVAPEREGNDLSLSHLETRV